MKASIKKPALLVLADGTFFEGQAIGYEGSVVGEVVFNTGMTGYQEVLTDPSYCGQLVAFTYPEIGNTGVNPFDQEASTPYVKGFIVRNFCTNPSNWRCSESLQDWLIGNKIVGISGIDTRALVRHIRDLGAMNGVISSDGRSPFQLLEELSSAPLMEGMNLANLVSTKEPYQWNSLCKVDFDQRKKPHDQDKSPFHVVAIDFGIKKTILDRLVAHGCDVSVLPANTHYEEVLSLNPEGVFLSNGPGDPSSVTDGIDLVQHLLKKADDLPIFGICLGHQILGLALGGSTYKLPFGHRGLNHPCGTSSKVEITSQNHGFALEADSLSKESVVISRINLNDGTVAAITLRDKPVFSVQYHPEASPGPHDADHFFEKFVSLMVERR